MKGVFKWNITMCSNVPNCGNYQNKILRNPNLLNLVSKKFKCIQCNKTSAIKKKTAWGLNIKTWGPYTNGMVAAKVCATLKANKK